MKILSWQYAAQDPDNLWELLAESEQDQFSVMYEKLVEHREPAIRLAKDELARTAADNWTEEEKDAFARRQANAAAALFKLGAPDALAPSRSACAELYRSLVESHGSRRAAAPCAHVTN